ncbi:MAG: hypothetical protein M1818_004171 [Claussenomyces sp. TS43310]|nr:MAG: hypothetical protein M1818_004171 [Claussenomyces sp. TS43310]
MRSPALLCLSLVAVVLPAAAKRPIPIPKGHTIAEEGLSAESVGQVTFEQLLDHDNPDLGTFSQRYWYNTEYWKGPGSPVVLFTPGESAADGYDAYLTNRSITGYFAQELEGAVILLEHRYWGDSSPYDDLTTENLQYLTLKNSIADLTYFAKTVKFPFDSSGQSNADKAPWVLSGGSYSGALAAWTESTLPGTFWAYHASSAPVEAIFDYWQYFYPVQDGMPANCSRDVSVVIDHVDEVLTTGTAEEKNALKAMFGLEGVEHADDFASAIENGPWLWQENTFTTGYSGFYQFCDAVEGVTAGQADTPGPGGVGLEKALAGYASYFNSSILPNYCQALGYEDGDDYNVACFDTYNVSNPLYTNYTVRNPFDRQWNWMLCNEPFAYWQDGAPLGVPTVVSRLVTASYWQRQCGLFFPQEGSHVYGSSPSHLPPLSVHTENLYTDGWYTSSPLKPSKRLIWTNGEFDPWRTTGVSSQFRPGGPLQSTPEAPVQVIPAGIHCSDLYMGDAKVNAGVQEVVDNEVKQIVEWVNEFYDGKRY